MSIIEVDWEKGQFLYLSLMDTVNSCVKANRKLSHGDVLAAIGRAYVSILRTMECEFPAAVDEIRDNANSFIDRLIKDEGIKPILIQ